MIIRLLATLDLISKQTVRFEKINIREFSEKILVFWGTNQITLKHLGVLNIPVKLFQLRLKMS